MENDRLTDGSMGGRDKAGCRVACMRLRKNNLPVSQAACCGKNYSSCRRVAQIAKDQSWVPRARRLSSGQTPRIHDGMDRRQVFLCFTPTPHRKRLIDIKGGFNVVDKAERRAKRQIACWRISSNGILLRARSLKIRHRGDTFEARKGQIKRLGVFNKIDGFLRALKYLRGFG